MKKLAVILSGSGVFDGTEINEAVLTLLHIAKAGAEYQCFAPDMEQMHVINHVTGDTMNETRNVLVESARIARGEITALTELRHEDFAGLILPGGFGAAKNLSNFAVKGTEAEMQPEVLAACKAFADANKPVGYMCIAPTIVPMVYAAGAKTTIGTDTDTAAAITSLGAEHIDCSVDDIVVDTTHKIVSTPAYMLAQNLLDADAGIEKLVKQVLEMA